MSAPAQDPKRRALGRGLDALLPAPREQAPAQYGDKSVFSCAIEKLRPQEGQPRQHFAKEKLEELAASIREHGLVQPIVVRRVPGQDKLEIIAGERRWRASQIAGLAEVPVLIREIPDEAALAMSLIENIQRENLNPIEEAHGIKRLIEEFRYSHEQAASAIGRSRSATSNLLRLLNLAEPVQTMLLAGDLDMGHARALVGLDRATQLMLASQIVEKRLSVREAERLVTTATSPGGVASGTRRSARRKPRDLVRIEEELAEALGTEVSITVGARKGGSLTIRFHGHEQFEDLVARLRG